MESRKFLFVMQTKNKKHLLFYIGFMVNSYTSIKLTGKWSDISILLSKF
jgi:hypothetical protein